MAFKQRKQTRPLPISFLLAATLALTVVVLWFGRQYLLIFYDNFAMASNFCLDTGNVASSLSSPNQTALADSLRILCLCLTTAKFHNERAAYVQQTWAKGCSEIVFVSDLDDDRLGAKNFSRQTVYNALWSKTRSAFEWAYESRLGDFDWFLKADDDSYVFMENLRSFLAGFDSSEHFYFGRRFLGWTAGWSVVPYADGGAGYVLSKGALTALVERAFSNNKEDKCSEAGATVPEDVEMGRCLYGIGIEPSNVVDSSGCQRFLFWPPWKQPTDFQLEKQSYIRQSAEPCPNADAKWYCAQFVLSIHNLTGVELLEVEKRLGKTGRLANWS